MAKKQDDKQLAWMVVDMASVKGAVANAHGAYKKAQELATAKRAEFEAAFIAEARKRKSIGDAQTLRFSYRFGNIAVAVDDQDEPKQKAGTFSLA